MKNRRFLSILLSVLILTSQTAFAATPAPGSSSTVTSPDGTTKTVYTETPAPDTDDDADDEDYDNENSDDENSDDENSVSDTSDTASDTASDDTTATETTSTQVLAAGETMESTQLDPPNIQYAQSALLMDMNSGRVLYSKNLDDRVYPASTTKIMTGILALEMCGDLSEKVTATYDALKSITLDDSQIGILVGEELTMEELMYAMLVQSANDAANVIAVHLAGSIEEFVKLMNNKAQELGMTGTNFVNVCGSHDDNHYTTARDLAIITKYAMKNETFREIVKTPIYKINPTNKYTRDDRNLVNTNLFLSTARSSYYYYPPAIGVKTGHTEQAAYCLVAAASYNDTELLAIVMNCKNADTKEQAYSYIDAKTLFEFGFENYRHEPLASVGDIIADSKVYEAKEDMRVAVTVESDISALIPNNDTDMNDIEKTINMPEQINAPITKGDVLGTITYTYRGAEIGTSNLVATNDVERNNVLHVFHLIIGVILNPLFLIPVIIIVIIILFARHRKKKRERQRRIQQLKRSRQKTAPENETGTRTPDRNTSRTERVGRETKGSNSRYRK